MSDRCAFACLGTGASIIAQTKFLKDENQRPNKIFAELTMQIELLKKALGKSSAASSATIDRRNGCEATQGKCCRGLPNNRGQQNLRSLQSDSDRQECTHRQSAGHGYGCVHYQRLRATLFALAHYRGHGWNHARVVRMNCKLEMNLRIKRRKRLMRDKPVSSTTTADRTPCSVSPPARPHWC